MKSIFTLLLAALAFVATAQPQKIHYQGVAVGANGKPIKNSTVGLRLSVLDSLPNGITLYTETQTASTDGAGQFSIYLGGGTAMVGTFANLPWANGNDKYLKVEMDAQGGTNYQPMGTTQLVSVPYAMSAGTAIHSENSNSLKDTLGNSFQPQTLNGQTVLVPTSTGAFNCGRMVSMGNENYPTVQIGNQCWFAKNINTGTIIAGTNDQTNNGIVEKYCYNDDPNVCKIYGGLYQWAEAVQYQNGDNNNSMANALSGNIQGICPSGWHLPSENDIFQLESYLGGYSIAGGLAKSTSSIWNSPNIGAINSSGFSALPSGFRETDGNFYDLSYTTQFWGSSTGIFNGGSNTSTMFKFLHDYSVSNRGYDDRSRGFSVRCLIESRVAYCNPPTTPANAGSDQLYLTGTATLAANTPAAGETAAWSILAGSGGSINSIGNPTATFTKGTDSTYTLVWAITGPCGTTTDTLNLRFPTPTACVQVVTYAGESYPIVRIGAQCWFAKNLNVGTMINSAAAVDSQRNNGIIEKFCYNNNPANCTTYGGLYQWAEAVQYQNGASNTASLPTPFTGNVRGICPTGWHLPSDVEWSSLETTLGGSNVAGGTLKSTSGLWLSPNTGATNSSGFSALPGGFRSTDGSFYSVGSSTYFWSSSESSSSNAISRYLYYSSSSITRYNFPKNYGFSARCTQD